jgi:Putative beta-barrel porin-2, OmpL-like. bbp2
MQDPRYSSWKRVRAMTWMARLAVTSCLLAMLPSSVAWAKERSEMSEAQQIEQLRVMVLQLQGRVDGLEHQLNERRIVYTAAVPGGAIATPVLAAAPLAPHGPSAITSDADSEIAANIPSPTVEPVRPQAAPQPPSSTSASPLASVLPTTLPGGATLNYMLDGYYEFNFNQPPGRVNYLRAYDVLSNVFSINQADIVLDWQPNVSEGRRYGARVDLQFGQATDTLQGNPANEPRPQIYQNIFQAYGTYIVPVGSGLSVDFGKWASSLGVEGNYTKDQMNYTRSLYFYFLPFYHEGIRASYKFNDKIQANYWIVNGTNQSEPTNGFKDEMFGFVLTPAKTVTWTSNYYYGQEHPDSTPASNCTVPVQPGLCVSPIIPAPNGKLHIFDNYVTWQVTPKLALVGEGDYFIEREWANAAPGESSAPSHVDGGAAYAQYQLTPKISLATRAEYMSDRQGTFSGKSQAMKEWTGTYKYNFGDGLDAFLEYRTDWSNQPYFQTHNPGELSQHQTTATVGLVWWYGGRQGSW